MDSVDDRRLLGSALLECLQCCDAVEKVSLTKALGAQWAARHLRPEYGDSVPLDLDQPGLPNNLQLVPPRQVPMRALGSEQGRIGLLHAVAHIEFNAINLALDAAYRFRDFPEAYYDDWISVAVDEAPAASAAAGPQRRVGADLPFEVDRAALGAGCVAPGDTAVMAGWSAPVQRVTERVMPDGARRMWVIY